MRRGQDTASAAISAETVQGCYEKAPFRQTGGEMGWRVSVELAGADGAVGVREVGVGERSPGRPAM
jgi:hypothetical protein